jgi:high-affinity iron transporter
VPAAFLLTLRETLEAVLIIGIIFSALRATQRTNAMRYIWLGSGTGILLSLLIAYLLNTIVTVLEGAAEKAFEGLTMLLAAAVLTWMIFWMQKQSSRINHTLKTEVRTASQQGGGLPLFSLAFLAVLREGLELSLFIIAASFTTEWPVITVGMSAGLIAAVGLGRTLSAGLLRLDLKRFFLVTSFLLILIAGGLIARGVHELNEARWIQTIIDHIWDLNPWFDEYSSPGRL